MARCLPGMPCYQGYDVTVYKTYPRGCTTSQSSPYTFPISTDNLSYTGANLPYTGIQTDDDLTEAIQKIDAILSAESIFELFLQAIDNDPSLLSELCTRIGTCP